MGRLQVSGKDGNKLLFVMKYMYLLKKKLLKGKEKKLSRKSICNICSVCNSNVSNDCTLGNVPSYVSIVCHCKYCR